MRLSSPIGPVSGIVVDVLRGMPLTKDVVGRFESSANSVLRPLADADVQLALTCCYELHYRGFEDVDDTVEWSSELAALTRTLERVFETALEGAVPRPSGTGDVVSSLRQLVNAETGPPLSTHLLRDAHIQHYRDFLAQRSVYHLKEADPHTWQVPRLTGRAKAALVEIQADEYGSGREAAMHSALFAQSMRALGLDDTYGAYWPEALAETHASVNLMTLFGLHRRHRGATLGHLAALEMTSTLPNRRYGNGLRRLGLDHSATAYFDEHVEADAVHEQIAAVDMCGSFVAEEPDGLSDVLWGAACCLAMDARAGAALLRRWGVVDGTGAA